MARPAARLKTAVVLLAAAVALGACSSQGIDVAKTSSYRPGAEIFSSHCSGCHTLSLVGAEGSASSTQGRLRTQAPNFDYRKECAQTVLYAIRNGGFSGQIMPQNIVVGAQAQAVAHFLARYAGLEAQKTPTVVQAGEPQAAAQAQGAQGASGIVCPPSS
jgi:mono/diheme cytochrome c family protein